MKTASTIALALALALAAGPVAAKEKPAAAGGPPKLSEKVLPLVQAAQKAIEAKDYATAKAKADEAFPSVSTPDDKLFIGNDYVQVGQATNDINVTGKGIDLLLDSGKAQPDLQPKLYTIQGQLAFQNKDYVKAEASLGKAYALNVAEPNLVPMLVESMRLQSKNAQALQTLDAAIAKQTAAGQPVPAEWYQRGYAIAYAAKPGTPDFDAIRKAGQQLNLKWLSAQPTPAAWHDVMLLVTQGKTGDADLMLDSRRLLLQANGLIGAADYAEFADSLYLKNPGEAKLVIDTGLKRNAFTLASNRSLNEINGLASGRIAADKASLAGSEKTAQTNPKVAQSLGDAYYGYGNYPKAIAMYKLAGTKGVDADLVNLRVGTALAASGDTAGAKAAFGEVKAGPRKDLADLWVIHLDHPTAG